MNEHTADKIYRTLFNKSVPPVIRERFVRAWELYSPGFSDADRAVAARAVETVKDLEALEMAARWAKRLPLLVWEYKVMVHLGETLPENRSMMVNTRNRKIYALLSLAGSGLRSTWKLAKGYVLLRRLERA